MLIETLTVTLQRNLAELHPLYKVLRPYLVHSFDVSYVIRRGLLDTGKMADQTLSVGGHGKNDYLVRAYSKLNVADLFLPKRLEARGLNDATKLENYRPREVGLELWRACADYIDSIFALYYPDHGDVIDDVELQAFIGDLHSNGVVVMNGRGETPGVPECFRTLHEAKDWITMVLFRSLYLIEALAYLVNFAFIPNAPTAMVLPPPSRKSTTTLEYIMRALPDEHVSLATVATVENLAKLQEEQVNVNRRRCGNCSI